MIIRKAVDDDIPRLLELLSQVLEIHAKIRPDIFISGTTKYTREELHAILHDQDKPVYVAEDDMGIVSGYAFCILKRQPFTTTMVQFSSMFIDDLCVDEKARGSHIGRALFEYVKNEAKRLECYDVTLNVWEGNDSARAFYDNLGMKIKETQLELII